MDSSGNDAFRPMLPVLKDPSSTGVFFVRHMASIVAFVFVALLLSIVVAASLIQLDITIKPDVDYVAKCHEKHSEYCARIYVSSDERRQIALNDHVLLVMEAKGTFRRKTLEATVVGIDNSAIRDGGKPLHAIEIKMIGGSPPPNVSPKFALVVVGSQSGLELLMASMPSIF